MSSPKTTGKTGPGSIKSKPAAIPALLAQAPGGAFARHRSAAVFLSRAGLPGIPDDTPAGIFAKPWGDLLARCPSGREPSILLSELSFGLGKTADFHFETLVDAGIRIVIAPFFGPALVSKAVRWSVLLVPLPGPEIKSLGAKMTADTEAELLIDLREQRIDLPGGESIPFATHPWLRTRLLHGMDDLDEQFQHRENAREFRARDRTRSPWLYRPTESGDSADPE